MAGLRSAHRHRPLRAYRSKALAVLSALHVACWIAAGPAAIALEDPTTTHVAFCADATGQAGPISWLDGEARIGFVRVGLAEPTALDQPSAQLELHLWQGADRHSRIVAKPVNGALGARVQTANGATWIDGATVLAAVIGPGIIELQLPASATPSPDQLLWADLTNAAGTTSTPLYRLDDLQGRSGGESRVADTAWSGLVPVSTSPGPSFTLDQDRAAWMFTQISPTQLAGKNVTAVEDIVHLRVPGTTRDPYELRLLESTNIVRLYAPRPAGRVGVGASAGVTSGGTVPGPAGAPAADPTPPDRTFQVGAKPPVGPGKQYVVPLESLRDAVQGSLYSGVIVSSSRRITLADGSVVAFGGVSQSVRLSATDAGGAGSGKLTTREQAMRVLMVVPVIVIVVALLTWGARRYRVRKERKLFVIPDRTLPRERGGRAGRRSTATTGAAAERSSHEPPPGATDEAAT